jgi:hypothetical protein
LSARLHRVDEGDVGVVCLYVLAKRTSDVSDVIGASPVELLSRCPDVSYHIVAGVGGEEIQSGNNEGYQELEESFRKIVW